MNSITIFYDERCGFCRFCRAWLEAQPKYVAMRFVPRDAEEVGRRWPAVAALQDADEMLVLDDRGGLYRGEKAYIVVLYALREWRSLSLRLAQPMWRGLARRAFRMAARNRYRLSLFASHEALLDRVKREGEEVVAASGVCETPLGAATRRVKAKVAHA